MKQCSKCGEVKPLTDFYSHSECAGGRRPECKICHKKKVATYHHDQETRKRIVAKKAEYYKANKETRDAQIGASNAKRRALKLKATPRWADYDAIRREFELAKWCSKVMGESYHVDHVIPLRGKFVCGLHVHTNLQVIRGSENASKNNRFEI